MRQNINASHFGFSMELKTKSGFRWSINPPSYLCMWAAAKCRLPANILSRTEGTWGEWSEKMWLFPLQQTEWPEFSSFSTPQVTFAKSLSHSQCEWSAEGFKHVRICARAESCVRGGENVVMEKRKKNYSSLNFNWVKDRPCFNLIFRKKK